MLRTITVVCLRILQTAKGLSDVVLSYLHLRGFRRPVVETPDSNRGTSVMSSAQPLAQTANFSHEEHEGKLLWFQRTVVHDFPAITVESFSNLAVVVESRRASAAISTPFSCPFTLKSLN